MESCPTIIGMACRLPGATNPSKLWDNIIEQRDLRRSMPKERFNIDTFYHPEYAHKGTTNTKYGYFLDQPLGDFDAEFFGISGKEAEAMDPQQRMLLEVVYEALENAGITLEQIRGSRTSVFCGSYTTANDYHAMQGKDLEMYPKYAITGTGNAILSNRISYFYNLHGPSMTVDTACSSSLVSLHLGGQSLINGEADMAIVLGSSLHFVPNVYQTMSDMGFVSPDGRCRTFDAQGSGYARGEGICAIVLKKYGDAMQNGDLIRAIVRGTGVNHDGKTDGITRPSADAQEALIRETYHAAGLNPDETQYFEAHGTGTKAGDPLEAKAIGAVFGTPTRVEPLHVGSVKTNIGHLEGAAGLAGVIKATLAIEKGKIPPNMLFQEPNPEILFEQWKLRVSTTQKDWPTAGKTPRRASVNSFGYGGANAHAILESYHDLSLVNGHSASNGHVNDRPYLLPITSHSRVGATLTSSSLRNYLHEKEDPIVKSLAQSLTFRRTLHKYRSFAIGYDRESVMTELATSRPSASWTHATDSPQRIGFVFTGQGAQSFDMGRQLIHQSPFFRSRLESCDAILKELPDGPSWSIVEELLHSENDSHLSQSRFSQPVCTALQLAIVDLLGEWGIAPVAVCGHSSGEIAAAYAAGILSLEAAITVAYYRGHHMSFGADYPTPGSMMAIGMSHRDSIGELEMYKERLTVAAVNSPSSVTVSGDRDAILEFQDALGARKVFNRLLKVKQAFHSHHMRPLAPSYERALAMSPHYETHQATCRMFSSVTGRVVESSRMGASYWADNMVQPVRFYEALVGVLLDDDENQNIDILIEIGPHAALKGPSIEIMSSLKINVPYLASLTRSKPAFEGLLEAAGQLFALGFPVNLPAVNKDYYVKSAVQYIPSRGKQLRDLPAYSWNHENHWFSTRLVTEYLHRPWRHSILGAPVPGSIDNMPRWRNYLRLSEIPWLRDHNVDNKVIFPAAGFVCMAVEAAVRLKPRSPISRIQIKDHLIIAPLTLHEDSEKGTETLLELHPVTVSSRTISDEWYEYFVSSYDENGQLTDHCRGRISIVYGTPEALHPFTKYPTTKQLADQSDRRLSASALYSHLGDINLHYGESFALLKEDIASGPGFSVTSLAFDPSVFPPHEVAEQTIIHPTLLDATYHVIFTAIESLLGRQLTDAFVPTFMSSLDISGILAEPKSDVSKRCYAVQTHTQLPSQRTAINDILLREQNEGEILLEARGVEVTALGTESMKSKGRTLFFRQRWQPCFNLLTSNTNLPMESQSLTSLLDLYTFQHPESTILYVSWKPEDVKGVLPHLLHTSTGRPVFRHMHIPSVGDVDALMIRDFEKLFGGLVKICDPEGTYDLIIVDAKPNGAPPIDLNAVMSPSTVFISNTSVAGIQDSLETIVPLVGWGAFRMKQQEKLESSSLTVITSSSAVSDLTEKVIERMRVRNGTLVLKSDFQTLPQKGITTKDVVVLSSLDEDIEVQDNWAGIRYLLAEENRNVIWVLRGAAMECSNPNDAKINGLLRTARNENQQSRFVSLDVEKTSSAELISQRVFQASDRRLAEEDLVDRNGCVYIPRIEEDVALNRKLPNGAGGEPQLQQLSSSSPMSLRIGKVGLLETLHFAEDENISQEPLGESEVEIQVKASAVNFRDIAISMGIIQDYKLGDECAGIVIRTGPKVDKNAFKPGDRVVAWRPGQGAHATVVRQPAEMCVKFGNFISFSLASSLPLIMTTAYYAVNDIGRLQPGETILIHSAAGGVGQIAIQLAQRIGARVLATCSEKKRELLRQRYGLPDSDIFSSRDDSFVRGVLEATNGKGVDVVINSLAGKLLQETWRCINTFGRFVEIGKRDIHQNSNLEMGPFRKNISFSSVDMVIIYEQNKPLGQRLLKIVFDMFFKGEIASPEGLFEFPYSQAEKAFRLLQLGKHTGKVVLVLGEDNVVPVAPPRYRNTVLFTREKTYLFVGGLGGLGTAVVEWMYLRGARVFAFLSRSGDDKADARETVGWLRSKQAQVTIYRGDVSILADVRRVVDDIGPSLGGVFHAAVVLQDSMIRSMTLKQLQIGMKAKCTGAQNLHEATLSVPLDFFICFSSVSAIFGTKGQGAYVAANAYIDALMRWRREQGLVGTTMNVGAILSRGLVAESAVIRQSLERNKLDVVTEQELMYLVEESIILSRHGSDPKGLDWHQLIAGINVGQPDVFWAERSVFRNLYANREYLNSPIAGKTTKRLIALSADPDTRLAVMSEAFIEKVASMLGTPVESITTSNPLSFYGLDSIVAVELRKWFNETADIDLSLFDVLSAKSINALVAKVVKSMPRGKDNAGDGTRDTETPKSNHINGELGSNSLASSSHIPKAIITGPIPMSTFQTRMFFQHMFLEEQWRLNLSGVFRLRGKPDINALHRSYREVVLHHPVLNSAFCSDGDILEQRILPEVKYQLVVHDLSGETHAEELLDQLVSEYKHRNLDIEQGEVAAWALIKISDEEYVLVIVAHHICFDRGSLFILMNTWIDLYNTLSSGRDSDTVLPPRIDYTDFTLWHNDMLNSEDNVSHLKFWQEYLHGAPETSQLLPFSKQERPEIMMPETAICQLHVAQNLVARMKRICAQINVTPFHFLLAAFRAFLFRYTGDRDTVLLMVDGNRPHIEAEDLVGCFVNMVPLRFQEDCSDMEFDSLVKSASEITLQSLSHSQIAFDEIVNSLQLPRRPGHMPVGQISINYQMHGALPTYRTSDFEVTADSLSNIPTPYEIALEAVENGDDNGLSLSVEYCTALYGAESMDRFSENFVTFLTSAIRDHRQPISEIDLCGAKEKQHLQANFWNTKFVEDAWADTTILQRIYSFAKTSPHHEAIKTSSGDSISYSELLQKASKLAYTMNDVGNLSSAVGVFMKAGTECIIGVLATLITSKCYVPLATSHVDDRLSFIIQDAGIGLVLTTEELRGRAESLVTKSGVNAQIITIKNEAVISEQQLPTFTKCNPDQPFYMIYTSGSTGNPKGVTVTHHATRQMLSCLHRDYHFSAQDRFLFATSISFDLSIVQIFSPLTCGATMCIANEDTRRDPVALSSFMLDEAVTFTYFTPTQLSLLLEFSADTLRKCHQYRLCFLCGERLPSRLVWAFVDLNLPAEMYNLYGLSETVVQNTSYEIRYGLMSDIVPIGRGLDNSRLYVVDPALHPVPAEMPGELYLGGALLALGYNNLPSKTQNAFLANPFATKEDISHGWTKMFRTGDRTRFLPCGALEFLGRINGDKQVKIRGHRVELGEVENQVRNTPEFVLQFVDVVVVYRSVQDNPQQQEVGNEEDKMLIAFLVLKRELSTQDAQKDAILSIHTAVSKFLNEYMLPSAYQIVQSLPLLPSGKLDLQKLSTQSLQLIYPFHSAPSDNIDPSLISHVANGVNGSTSIESIDPSISTAQMIIQIFHEVLAPSAGTANNKNITPETNFFEAGGNSILMMRLQSRIWKKFSGQVKKVPSLAQMFTKPTPRALAEVMLGVTTDDMKWSQLHSLLRK